MADDLAMSDAKTWMQANAKNLVSGEGPLPHWRFPDRSIVCWDDYLTTFWPAEDGQEADREIRRRARNRSRWRFIRALLTSPPLLLAFAVTTAIWAVDVGGILP